MGQMISFARSRGSGTAQGYLAESKNAKGPGIVVIQEWWGLQGQIKAVCDNLAQAGFSALAPDLYNGKVVPYHNDKEAAASMSSLDFKTPTKQEVPRAVAHPKYNGGKIRLNS